MRQLRASPRPASAPLVLVLALLSATSALAGAHLAPSGGSATVRGATASSGLAPGAPASPSGEPGASLPSGRPADRNVPAGSSPLPAVASTLVLWNNTTVPGNYIPPVVRPQAVAYAPEIGEIFVSNPTSVVVINDTADAVVATVPLAPYSIGGSGIGGGLAYDPATNEVFVADFDSNLVSVLAASNNTVVSTVAVGNDPTDVAYDSGQHEVFVASLGSGVVDVIADSNDTVVATVDVSLEPIALAYDPARGEVLVADGSGAVSVIADSNDTVVGTVNLSSPSNAIAYDSGRGEIFVGSGDGEMAVISDSNDTVVGTVDVSTEGYSLAYDQAAGEVLAATEGGSVVAISDLNDSVVATTGLDYLPQGLVYDAGRGELFVGDDFPGGVSILSVPALAIVAAADEGTAAYPVYAAAYDPVQGEIFVTESGESSVAVINDTTGREVRTVGVGDEPDGIAYDSALGEVFVANYGSDNVSVIAASSERVVATVPVANSPEALAYDPDEAEVLVAEESGNLSAIADADNTVVATVAVADGASELAYDSGLGEIFVASGDSNVVTVLSGSNLSEVATVSVGNFAAAVQGLAYDAARGETFAAERTGPVAVLNDSTLTIVATIPTGPAEGAAASGLAYDPLQGEMYAVVGTTLEVIDDATNSVVGTLDIGNQTGISPEGVVFDAGQDAVFAVNGFIYESETVSDIPAVAQPVTPWSGALAVSSTLVLWNGTVVPGGYTPGLYDPVAAVYDPAASRVLVADAASGDIDVIAATNDTLVTTVAVGVDPAGLAFDSARGELFVANSGSDSVSVVDLANDTVVATVPVGSSPEGLAYDNVSGEIFVANEGSNTVSVIADANNTVVATVTVGEGPDALAYDPARGELFVANSGSANVSVLWVSNRTVAATVGVGTHPDGIAYDSGRSEVFVANGGSNTVSVVDDANLSVVATVATPQEPVGVAYDPAQGEVFVADAEFGAVSVIADSNDTIVASPEAGRGAWGVAYDPSQHEIVVTSGLGGIGGSCGCDVAFLSDSNLTVVGEFFPGLDQPGALVYDGGKGEVFVAEPYLDAVLVLDDTSDRILATVPVGLYPAGLAYDPRLGEVFVANEGSNTTSVISDANDTVVATVPVGLGPDGVAYDPQAREVFVANGASGDVSVIADSNDSVVETIPVGAGPDGVAYDNGTGALYVANERASTVSVLSGAPARVTATIAVGPFPTAVAYDSGRSEIFVADSNLGQGSSAISVIADADNAVVVTLAGGIDSDFAALAYDPARGAVFAADPRQGELVMVNDTSDQEVSVVAFACEPEGLAFDARRGAVFVGIDGRLVGSRVLEPVSGSVAVVPDASPPGTGYAVTFSETGLPSGAGWALTLEGATGSLVNDGNTSTFASIVDRVPDGNYTYLATSLVAGFQGEPGYGNLTVNGSSVNVVVRFEAVYAVSFSEAGLPAGTEWSVAFHGLAKTSQLASITFYAANASWAFTAYAAGYTALPASGNLSVDGAEVAQTIDFAVGGAGTYVVTIVESGLPSEGLWWTDLAGSNLSSRGSSLEFLRVNGTYAFTVGTLLAYAPDPVSATLVVRGGATRVDVTFAALPAGEFTVRFSEVGLPTGTNWSVTLGGTRGSSNGTALAFVEPNGSYAFDVGPVPGDAAVPSSGTVNVSAGPAAEEIRFGPVPATPAKGFLGLPGNEGYFLLAGAGVAAGALAATGLTLYRRRPARPPGPAPKAGAGGPPAAP